MESTNASEDHPIVGELVLQNGRQAGTRRPLNVPATFIGRSPGCDIRLNIDGIDPTHCVLVIGADGPVARDLNSDQGTYINGERIDSAPVRHGDILKVGPFQFRVEMSSAALIEHRARVADPACELGEAAQIQVAAVLAQQIALEEDEAKLLQRQSDMRQQEEQLAAHLAEKQRQIQMWSDHTKSERTVMRKQKAEQNQLLSEWEQQLTAAREHLGADQQRINQERDRVNKVYERLRQRWRRQWAAQKEKYDACAAKLEADTQAAAARQEELNQREARLADETLRFNTEREQSARQLQEGWEELKQAQQTWRRRHTQERTLWKAREQEVEETVAKMNEARKILQQEREAWKKQQEVMHKELHGLNNRIVHQRQKIKEQEARSSTLDAELRTRLLHLRRVADIETGGTDAGEPTSALPVPAEFVGPTEPASSDRMESAAPGIDEDAARIETLDRLAAELADQRVHLVEQYKRLAEIQDLWSLQREQAAAEMEVTARQLCEREQALEDRERQAAGNEESLQREHDEIHAVRREIQVWRSRLQAREQAVEQAHQSRLEALKQEEALLREQLEGLTQLRQRWSRRRQDEIEFVRAEQARLRQQRDETARLRQELFDKGQQLEEEKRSVAEKALAVELYRQETVRQSADPAAERRMERLRRRWVMQNSVLIREAKNEREFVKAEMTQLEARCDEWFKQMEAVTQADAVLAEKLTELEEREAHLKAHEQRLIQENCRHAALRTEAIEKLKLMRHEVEQIANIDDEEPEAPTWPLERAA